MHGLEQFKYPFSKEVHKTLWLPEYWILESPRDWTAVNYFIKLLQNQPDVRKRNAHQRLKQDVDIVKKYVITGTLGEVAIDHLIKQLKAGAKRGICTDPIIKKFWDKHAISITSSTVSYNTTKLQFKSAITAEVTQELEASIPKRRRIDYGLDDSDDGDTTEENEEEGIWTLWKKFLEDLQIALSWHTLSPEKHGVIWCGKQLARRYFMPGELYERTLKEIPPYPVNPIHQSLRSAYSMVLDTGNINDMKKAIKRLQYLEEQGIDVQNQVEFLVDNLNIFAKTVHIVGNTTLMHSENCLKSDALWPALQVVAAYLRNTGQQAIFYSGEEELISMSQELHKEGQNDGRLRYYADGVIRINDAEVLIFEASSAYERCTVAKATFDHYKAITMGNVGSFWSLSVPIELFLVPDCMFGMLGVLRYTASRYCHASFDTFKKLKIHFVHALGSAIRQWTMSVIAEGVYLMHKVDKAEIPMSLPNSSNDALHHFIQLHWNLGGLQETADTINELKKEHGERIAAHRFDNRAPTSPTLTALVKPLIVRLTERKHSKEIEDDGPKSPAHIV
ncbi:hypothetical protein EC973_000682 [Apophysomyces ossiformis]|uniref:Uncharacterized protein n=1 Tax=Apophysomyces ossiformis TaxID=679940 RepID=A0A8H7BYT4_9FUNG|nr:hypothetical protein EC973_000682 [Apophysomyces ossiformis]